VASSPIITFRKGFPLKSRKFFPTLERTDQEVVVYAHPVFEEVKSSTVPWQKRRDSKQPVPLIQGLQQLQKKFQRILIFKSKYFSSISILTKRKIFL
jgi:hypothetical protein